MTLLSQSLLAALCLCVVALVIAILDARKWHRRADRWYTEAMTFKARCKRLRYQSAPRLLESPLHKSSYVALDELMRGS